MDIVFNCPHCNQDLAVDGTGAGSTLECPSCKHQISVPDATPDNIKVGHPADSSAAAKVEHHFSVPDHEGPAELLIKEQKPKETGPLRDEDRKLRTRTIKHGECIEVGKDIFDDVITKFIQKVGEEHIVSLHPIAYSHIDIVTQKLQTDYGVIILYRG